MKSLLCYKKGSDFIPQNEGKKFEYDFKQSIPDNCWIYRLKDNASSFSGGNNTRFASSNICDYIMLDDNSKTLYLLELKSTKSNSIPLSMIRQNQIDGLLKASKHVLKAGIIINFRNKNNDTFFISINNFLYMLNNTCKKSFNIKDLENANTVRIYSSKKRTRYRYDIQRFISEVHL